MTPTDTPCTNLRPVQLCGSVAAIASLIAIAVGTFQPSNADAYALEGPKWPNGSTVVMQLSLGNAGKTLADGNTSWNAAVSPALDDWNAVVGNMQFGQVMNSTAAVSSGDHVNSMAFASTNFGHSFGSSTLAVTTYWFSGSTMTEADILFNSNQPWDSYRGGLRSAYDVRRVALHESGHALGMAHSSLSSAIMYAYISSNDTLSSDDISGAQSIYGAASGTPTPTPSPTVTPTATPAPTTTPTVTPSATPTATPSLVAVSLSVSPTTVRSGGSADFTVSTSTPASTAITVNYRMSGNAALGSNYSLSGTPGQFTIEAGASSATVTLDVLTIGRKSKTATMSLQFGSDYTLSGSTSASVSIRR